MESGGGRRIGAEWEHVVRLRGCGVQSVVRHGGGDRSANEARGGRAMEREGECVVGGAAFRSHALRGAVARGAHLGGGSVYDRAARAADGSSGGGEGGRKGTLRFGRCGACEGGRARCARPRRVWS